MHRIVIDTNVLIAAAYNKRSASHRIIDACKRGKLAMVLSPAVRSEYDRILPRAAPKEEATHLANLIDAAEVVVPVETPRVVPNDPEDDKFLAAALAAGAEALVTNDQHVLSLDPYGKVRIVRPADFVARWLDAPD